MAEPSAAADLPPDSLLDKAELAVDRLNEKVYGSGEHWLALPLQIAR